MKKPASAKPAINPETERASNVRFELEGLAHPACRKILIISSLLHRCKDDGFTDPDWYKETLGDLLGELAGRLDQLIEKAIEDLGESEAEATGGAR